MATRVPDAEQHSRGDEHAVGVNGDGAELYKDGIHSWDASDVRRAPALDASRRRKSSSITKTGADDDSGIGNVKCVPVIIADVKVDEVGDAVAQHAIEDVSHRPAQNQREPALAEPAASAARKQKPGKQTQSPTTKK